MEGHKMKIRLVTIDKIIDPTYYIGIGTGFEYDDHGYFVGIIVAFFPWTIRIGINKNY